MKNFRNSKRKIAGKLACVAVGAAIVSLSFFDAVTGHGVGEKINPLIAGSGSSSSSGTNSEEGECSTLVKETVYKDVVTGKIVGYKWEYSCIEGKAKKCSEGTLTQEVGQPPFGNLNEREC